MPAARADAAGDAAAGAGAGAGQRRAQEAVGAAADLRRGVRRGVRQRDAGAAPPAEPPQRGEGARQPDLCPAGRRTTDASGGMGEGTAAYFNPTRKLPKDLAVFDTGDLPSFLVPALISVQQRNNCAPLSHRNIRIHQKMIKNFFWHVDQNQKYSVILFSKTILQG